MEYAEGKPLAGPLPIQEAISLALQIASAMEEAHTNGILHRDLKPTNVLVTHLFLCILSGKRQSHASRE